MLMKLAAVLFCGVAAALSIPMARADEGPLQATVRVDAAAATTPLNRLVLGGFIEHFHRQIYGGIFEPGSPLSDEKGFRKDVIAALRELRLSVVRWPGGCFVSAYHWKDGVGPNRRPSFDKAWGVEDPNTFGTDEFVAWCRLVGTEPYICGNAGTGTPEEMSDWVEYCNQDQGRWARLRAANGHPHPYRVRYWSIGNENYGDWEIGTKTTEEWGLFVRETAKMIRRVDPSTVLLAAALPDTVWTKHLLNAAGHNLNMVSIHGYYDPLWAANSPSNYATCTMRSRSPRARSPPRSGSSGPAASRAGSALPSTSGTSAAGTIRAFPPPSAPRISRPATAMTSPPPTAWRTPCSRPASSTPACGTATR